MNVYQSGVTCLHVLTDLFLSKGKNKKQLGISHCQCPELLVISEHVSTCCRAR